MLVPDDVRKCVVFLAYRVADGYRLVGTAWFVARTIPDSDGTHPYLVTAKHLIEAIRRRGLDKVYARYNLKNGTSGLVETAIGDWLSHPTDPSVDVAAIKGGIPEGGDHLLYPLERFATREIVGSQAIGVGEEVFLTGLFVNHVGQSKNIPIVRVGNIAAMPEEPVGASIGPIEAYLIEARSIGGLSGSPVFAHLGVARLVNGQARFASGGPIFYLLGLMHGHWDLPTPDVDELAVDDGVGVRRSVNMGIAIVVPAWRIAEVLDQPTLAYE